MNPRDRADEGPRRTTAGGNGRVHQGLGTPGLDPGEGDRRADTRRYPRRPPLARPTRGRPPRSAPQTEQATTTVMQQPAPDRRAARSARRGNSGTKTEVSTSAIKMTGRLIQNTDRQPAADTSAPPASGPAAMRDAEDRRPHADRPGPLLRAR